MSNNELELNELSALINTPTDNNLSVGKIMSVSGTTLTLGVKNNAGGLTQVSGVHYLNSFIPVAGATCWYTNFKGSILVVGQQENVSIGPRTKLVTLLGAQESWTQGTSKTLLRSVSGTSIVIVKWETPNGYFDSMSISGSVNRLSIGSTSGDSTAYGQIISGDLSFSGSTATLDKAARYNVVSGNKAYPDSLTYPYQIFALL